MLILAKSLSHWKDVSCRCWVDRERAGSVANSYHFLSDVKNRSRSRRGCQDSRRLVIRVGSSAEAANCPWPASREQRTGNKKGWYLWVNHSKDLDVTKPNDLEPSNQSSNLGIRGEGAIWAWFRDARHGNQGSGAVCTLRLLCSSMSFALKKVS